MTQPRREERGAAHMPDKPPEGTRGRRGDVEPMNTSRAGTPSNRDAHSHAGTPLRVAAWEALTTRGASGLVVDVEVAGRIAQRRRGLLPRANPCQFVGRPTPHTVHERIPELLEPGHLINRKGLIGSVIERERGVSEDLVLQRTPLNDDLADKPHFSIEQPVVQGEEL